MSSLEYAILVGLLVSATTVGVNQFKTEMPGLFQKAANALGTADPTPGSGGDSGGGSGPGGGDSGSDLPGTGDSGGGAGGSDPGTGNPGGEDSGGGDSGGGDSGGGDSGGGDSGGGDSGGNDSGGNDSGGGNSSGGDSGNGDPGSGSGGGGGSDGGEPGGGSPGSGSGGTGDDSFEPDVIIPWTFPYYTSSPQFPWFTKPTSIPPEEWNDQPYKFESDGDITIDSGTPPNMGWEGVRFRIAIPAPGETLDARLTIGRHKVLYRFTRALNP